MHACPGAPITVSVQHPTCSPRFRLTGSPATTAANVDRGSECPKRPKCPNPFLESWLHTLPLGLLCPCFPCGSCHVREPGLPLLRAGVRVLLGLLALLTSAGGLSGATYLALCTSTRPAGSGGGLQTIRPLVFLYNVALCPLCRCVLKLLLALRRECRSPAAAFGLRGGSLPIAGSLLEPTCQAAGAALGPMCGVALLAAPALKLVWCLFATGSGWAVSLWMVESLMPVQRAGLCFLLLQVEVDAKQPGIGKLWPSSFGLPTWLLA